MKYFHATDGETDLVEEVIHDLAILISQSPENALEYLKGVGVMLECVRYSGLHEDQFPQPDADNFPKNPSDTLQQNNINQTSEP